MKLWLVSRTDSVDYDQHDSFVVVAEDEESARQCMPGGSRYRWGAYGPEYLRLHYGEETPSWKPDTYGTWARTIDHVVARCVGDALPDAVAGTVICASFNAG